MSDFKGTPGPWFVGTQNDLLYVIDRRPATSNDYPDHDADVAAIAKVYCGNASEANARLIAAAPELLDQHEADMVDLDLLAKAIHAGDPMPELVIRVTDMLNRKRAAIAKATGGPA